MTGARHAPGLLVVGLLPAAGLLLAPILPAGSSQAQLIPIRTVPVAAGDQFLVHATDALGRGGVSVALDDPLLDPFLNPAKGARLRDGRIVGAPTAYGFRNDAEGGGRTLPLTVLLGSASWFGGLSVALQEVEAADFRPQWRQLAQTGRPGGAVVDDFRPLSRSSASNTYLSGFLGRSVETGAVAGRLSVGGAVTWAPLGAVQGVEHLYASALRVEEEGELTDVRAGLLWEDDDGRAAEAVVVHNRFDVSHRIHTFAWVRPGSDVGADDPAPGRERLRPELRSRTEEDRTRTWGLHLGWRQPLPESDWRAGGALTVNRKSHPKIPNYEIMNIPRDPGTTWAYALAAGMGRDAGPVTAGFDLSFEPIWSETWVEAEESVGTRSGGVIPPGERTIENDFFFKNSSVRAGVGLDGERGEFRGGLQAGLRARTVRYTLDQHDLVEERRREQRESWTEWGPTWGAHVAHRGIEVRYRGRSLHGTGRPGVEGLPGPGPGFRVAAGGLDADFLPAPRGSLFLRETRVRTHQLSVSLPLR